MAVQRARDVTPHAPVAIDDPRIEYPSSDGEPLAESDHQYIPLTDTVSTLRNHYRDRTDVYVAGDMLLYYVLNNPSTSVAPDVYAVFGALGNHPRDTWVVSREGGKVPDFVLEVASRSTWRRDREEKREIYADIGVSEYWRFDPTGRVLQCAAGGGASCGRSVSAHPDSVETTTGCCVGTARYWGWSCACSPTCHFVCTTRSETCGCSTINVLKKRDWHPKRPD